MKKESKNKKRVRKQKPPSTNPAAQKTLDDLNVIGSDVFNLPPEFAQKVLDALPVPVYIIDANGRFTHFNNKAIEFAGHELRIGDLWHTGWKVLYLDGRPMPHDERPLGIALKTGKIMRGVELLVERENGNRSSFSPHITLLHDKKGKLLGLMNIVIDTTDKNTALTELKQSEIRYRRLFESAHDGVLILDLETGQITDVNPYLIQMLGYTKAEFLSKKLWEVGAFRNMKTSKDLFVILQKEGYVRYDNLPLETEDGKLVSVEFVCNSYLENGVRVIQCNIRDITERLKIDGIKETQRLLGEEKFKVEAIANTAHELRTPLAIMQGNVDLAMIGKGKSPKNALRAISYEIKHLTSLLSDLSLITSKAWELKHRIVYEEIKLRSLVGTTIKRATPLAKTKNISVKSLLLPDITLVGDKGYLEKMLLNLIRNSIIYGHIRGHTTITAKQSKGVLTISVADDGIGISVEDLPHVFERFYRAEKRQKSGGQSVGLGLAIVKWVAEIHGGAVSVKSNLKKGTVFSVSLLIKNSEKNPEPIVDLVT